MPPASAKAIASLISRRAKYRSVRRRSPAGWLTPGLHARVGTDRSVGAQLAWPRGMLGAEREVTGGDPREAAADLRPRPPSRRAPPRWTSQRRRSNSTARARAPWQQPALRRKPVEPELRRVGLEQRRVEAGVGLVVDERPCAHPARRCGRPGRAPASPPRRMLNPTSTASVFAASERVAQVAREHLAAGFGPVVEREQVSARRVPGGQRRVHRRAQLGRARGTHEARLQLVGRRGHPPDVAEPVAHGQSSKSCSCEKLKATGGRLAPVRRRRGRGR